MEIDRNVALAVKSAETLYLEAVAKQESATDKADKLKRRIEALQSERQTIVRNRAKSDVALPDDGVGARLALINADIEGLTPLLSQAEQEVRELDPAPTKQAFETAKGAFERHKAQVEFAGLEEKAREAQEHVVNVVTALHAAGKRLGRQHLSMNWKQTHNFRRLVSQGALPA